VTRHQQQQQVRPAGAQDWANASRICSSSPAWVLAAIHTGRFSPKTLPAAIARPCSISVAGSFRSYFKLPVTCTRGAPKALKALGISFGLRGDQGNVAQHGQRSAANPCIALRRAFRQPGVGDDHRNFSHSHICRNTLGHNSVSMMTAIRGWVLRRNRATAPGKS
jgi:hypothetical protein